MIYQFGAFELDPGQAELRQSGQPIPIEPQVFRLLALLLENRDRVVSRDEIFEKIWDGRIVGDSALASRVKSARKALGDDGRDQRFIKTIHGRGFRFVAEVRVERPVSALLPGEDPLAGGALEVSAKDTRPSIAVLPFSVLGDADRFATIAEGLPHELIAEMARLRWLFVIARASSFRLRGYEQDMREVGRLLGARYCIAGTTEVTGTQLTVTTELVDTRGGHLIWGERYNGPIDDLHAMRSEILAGVLTALEIRIPLHEAAEARLAVSEDLDAWSAYHLGLQHLYRFNRADNGAAEQMFERATALDPEFARAHAGLSFTHFQSAFLRQTDDVAGKILLSRRCAERGVEIDPLDPFVNFAMGRSYWLDGDLDSAMEWLERSVTLSPNYAQGIYSRAWTQTMSGRGQDGRRDVDVAMRLSPLDPLYYAMLATRGLTHLVEGDYSKAAAWVERAAHSPGAHVLITMIAAIAQALAGNDAAAAVSATTVRERAPQLTIEDFFRAFPVRSAATRSRMEKTLASLGFGRR